MSKQKRDSGAEKQISDARKMPGYPGGPIRPMQDGAKIGDAAAPAPSMPGAPGKLPGYKK